MKQEFDGGLNREDGMLMAARVFVPRITRYSYNDLEDEVRSRGLEFERGLAVVAGVGAAAMLGLLYRSQSKNRK